MPMRLIILAALLLGSTNACTFGARTAPLSYPRSLQGVHLSPDNANSADYSGSNGRTFRLGYIRDMRVDGNMVGGIRDALRIRTAKAYAGGDISAWVRSAFQYELRRIGFALNTNAEPHASHTQELYIEAEVLKVYCDAFLSMSGEVSLAVKASTGNGPLVNRVYEGRGRISRDIWYTGERFGKCITIALENALDQITSDLVSRLNEDIAQDSVAHASKRSGVN